MWLPWPALDRRCSGPPLWHRLIVNSRCCSKQFNQQLGHGSFKAVYKGYDEEEGIEVAWCQVNMDRVGEAEKAQIQTEVDILKSLDHKVREAR